MQEKGAKQPPIQKGASNIPQHQNGDKDPPNTYVYHKPPSTKRG